MKKSELIRAHVERFLNDFLETIARAAGLGFIVIASTVIGVQAGQLLVKNACAAEHNLVEVPAYSGVAKADVDGDEYPKPDLKYQYEAVNDEKPILKKKSQKDDVAHGASHVAGDELVINPDSDEFETTDEPIVERLSDEELKAETAAASPAPTEASSESGTRNSDIGRRTAEVR
jgi:hypothetical protein